MALDNGASIAAPDALQLAIFADDAACYFRARDTNGEDRAHWSNVYNAQNCDKIAATLRLYHSALKSIVSFHADARDVFPDWKTTAQALAEIAAETLEGRDWQEGPDAHPSVQGDSNPCMI